MRNRLLLLIALLLIWLLSTPHVKAATPSAAPPQDETVLGTKMFVRDGCTAYSLSQPKFTGYVLMLCETNDGTASVQLIKIVIGGAPHSDAAAPEFLKRLLR